MKSDVEMIAAGGWCAPADTIYDYVLDPTPWWPGRRLQPNDETQASRWAVEDVWLAKQWALGDGQVLSDLEFSLVDLPSLIITRGGVTPR